MYSTEQTNLVRSLLNNDPSLLNSVDSDGRTALHWAASSGALDVVRELLTHGGVEVDKRDNSQWTPLMIAGVFSLLLWRFVFPTDYYDRQ